MVIDYRRAWLAAEAVRSLDGQVAAEIVWMRVAVSEDPAVTQLLVHRVVVPEAVADRARAILAERGLLDPWWLWDRTPAVHAGG